MIKQLKGPDVSNHNGTFNWDKALENGIDFAMIRMGFGSDREINDDTEFERNVAECERLGIPWGAYLYSYAMNVEDVKSEVRHALRLLIGKTPRYPIAFDMEDADGYKQKRGMPSNKTLVDICDTFLSALESEGYKVSLYASKHWLDTKLDHEKLDRYDKWVAQWGEKCTYSKPFGMWQYTDREDIDGIGGRTDMNIAFIDYSNSIDTNKPPEKTVDELAQEVIDGLYGNGDDRKRSLGDRYDEVQRRVNDLLGTSSKPTPKPEVGKKTIDQLADEVMKGLHGNGRERMISLGSNYAKVQAEVTRRIRNR